MGALLSLVLSALGGWPLALLRGAWSVLIEAVRTPLGAAVVAALVVWPIADHRGAARIEARDAEAVAIETARRGALDAADRRDAKADGAQIVARAAERARLSEEIFHVPIPAPRPGDACGLDGRRLR